MAQMTEAQPKGCENGVESTLSHEGMVTLDDFETLFIAFQQRIISFIVSRIGNREQAYDLAQDTFIKAFKAIQSGAIVYQWAFSAWIYRIASNTTTDALRRKRLIAWIPLSVFTDDRSIGAGVPNDARGRFEYNEGSTDAPLSQVFSYNGGLFENYVADKEIVEHILWKSMDAKHSLCLWLYENDGLSCAEIGELLDISTSAVKMRLMRARQRFAELYLKEMEKE